MVAKISVGNSLYGAIAYNGEKINEAQGRLLTTNRIYNDGSGKVDINKAMEGFLTFMPPQMKVEKPVVHISLNPHPEDALTDAELQDIAREYLEKLGFGNQPYLVFKHEDIDRHHLHIVTVRVDENGKCISDKNNYYRSKQITRELEKKYGLHDAERRNRRLDTPLSKVDASAGDVKKQVGNTVKALNGQYRFQTMGEYRALLSIYNLTVEEARGNVRGREYHGLVYSVTDGRGNKVGNPFKSSLFGKSAGYEAMQKKFVRSRSEIKDRKLADMTKRTVLSVLQGTYDKDRFVSQLKEKGIDTVLRYTEEGRIYGATFIDHRTGSVLNGSRMGKELSANALQEHFTLPYAGQPPIPLSIPMDAADKAHGQTAYDREDVSGGMGLLTPEGPAVDAEEEAFIRAMKRKKKKKRKVIGVSTIKKSMYVTTRRRFEGIGENHGFSACREYHFSGHERVLVLLRSHPAMGREHRCGGQNPSELRPHGGAVPFHSVHETVCRPAACPVLSGYERGQGRENHLGKNMDGTRRRIRAVFPQLVDTGSAAAG